LPDISKINNVAVADISKLDSITFAHGMKVNNQDVSLAAEAHTLIGTATASSSATLEFTSNINDTYDVYEFRFDNIHAVNNNVNLTFQVNATDGADYNDSPITSTFFYNSHSEGNAVSGPGYEAGFDSAQISASYTLLATYFGNQEDESASGVMRLYAPSSPTYVKHWTSEIHLVSEGTTQDSYARSNFTAGYINDTTAIDKISFKLSGGAIQTGEIKMYGIAKA
jgi:hypothetical protein|tara:strand:+ start:501 stop:1175 length:675 start_codon:yes stop_codon:yes gene_type:complete